MKSWGSNLAQDVAESRRCNFWPTRAAFPACLDLTLSRDLPHLVTRLHHHHSYKIHSRERVSMYERKLQGRATTQMLMVDEYVWDSFVAMSSWRLPRRSGSPEVGVDLTGNWPGSPG